MHSSGVVEGFGNIEGHLKAGRPNRLWSQTLNILLFFLGAGASSTMDRWRREFEQAMEAQRAKKDEDFKEFEEFFFDKLVIAPLLFAEGFLVVFLNTLHLHFVHLCNEYGEPHYSLNGWWHGHKLVIWTKLMTCISMCRWGPNWCCWGYLFYFPFYFSVLHF
jgi:hypothetical protein